MVKKSLKSNKKNNYYVIDLIFPVDQLGFFALAIETCEEHRFGKIQIVDAKMLL